MKKRVIDKNFCMSSYLTFRYIENENIDFYENVFHSVDIPFPDDKKIIVNNALEIADAYKKAFESVKDRKLGLLLSGGMDSACLAAFLPAGTDAYTFRFLDNGFTNHDITRAEKYAEKYHLNLHYVDINWDIVEKNLPKLLLKKGAPVHSIEPQIMEAALQAKKDGVEMMVAADGSDLVFGGMDKMLSKDWKYDEWKEFYTFCNPEKVLKNPVSMEYVFERYKLPNNEIDYLRFIDEIFAHESSASYCNAFITAEMKYTPFFDPSGMVKMGSPLDLDRIRRGESKYLIRELFKLCYPEFDIPEKIPMPRPVDIYFEKWSGPKREEFKKNLDMSEFTGNQKWQIYCLEQFLNLHEPL
ncbi:asparagine synthase-related protein [Enterococcus cecorum]|uniref:asparagine synthase-related protein n=1 Tax=Enterococcus cecorum TaxID=44008 RepID=UPI003F91D8EB